MRRKKHKHTRRAVRFYRINFGFRPPYKVLLDGNFVHAIESQKRGDCKEQTTKLLGDPARVFTTKCIMKELKDLGKEYSGTRAACKQFALHHCGHEDPVSASDCLASQIESGNSEHFFIATQDKSLQRRVMSHTGCAVIFASVNGIHLDTPSEHQKRLAQETQRAQQKPRHSVLQGDDENGDVKLQSTPIFKRKKAKGPNPLSMKPKQKKAAVNSRADDSSDAKVKRKRQRRKGKADDSDA